MGYFNYVLQKKNSITQALKFVGVVALSSLKISMYFTRVLHRILRNQPCFSIVKQPELSGGKWWHWHLWAPTIDSSILSATTFFPKNNRVHFFLCKCLKLKIQVQCEKSFNIRFRHNTEFSFNYIIFQFFWLSLWCTDYLMIKVFFTQYLLRLICSFVGYNIRSRG